MAMIPRVVLTGLASYVPGAQVIYRSHFVSPDPSTPEKCYGLWLKHYSIARNHGLTCLPKVLGELGPGGSIGVGLAALICGVNSYFGLDAVPFAETAHTLSIFDTLVDMLRRRETPSNIDGFPNYSVYCSSNGFPSGLLSDKHLSEMLDASRISELRRAVELFVRHPVGDKHSKLRYIAPWTTGVQDFVGSADYILSHVVLQYIDEMEEAVEALHHFLRPDGIMSHQIGLGSSGIAREWNGHWACPEWLWRIARGRKYFLINRYTHSMYLELFQRLGFQVTCDLVMKKLGGIQRSQLSARWSTISDDDLQTAGTFIVAKRLERPPARD